MITTLWRYFPLLVAISVGLAGYYYVTNLQDSVKKLTNDNTSLSLKIETERQNTRLALEQIDGMRAAQRELVRTIDEMRTVQIQAGAELERLDDIFSEHNFGALAQGKPGLIQNRVNRGTADVIRMLECATGKPRSDC